MINGESCLVQTHNLRRVIRAVRDLSGSVSNDLHVPLVLACPDFPLDRLLRFTCGNSDSIVQILSDSLKTDRTDLG